MSDQEVDQLYARVRKDDDLLREYFSNIKKADRPYEVRRLLEKSIKLEQKQQEIIENITEE